VGEAERSRAGDGGIGLGAPVIPAQAGIQGVRLELAARLGHRGGPASDDAASKLLWLALRNITAHWGRAAKEWKEAMNQFAILYEDRFTRTGK
jgi:putative transposase